MPEVSMTIYWVSILGLLLLALVPLLLAGVASVTKAQAGLPPGAVLTGGYTDAFWRAERTHMNAVENVPVFLLVAVLAMLAGVGPVTLAILVWVQVALRLGFSLLYLRGVGAVTGGPRSMAFTLGLLVTLVLIAVTAWRALAGAA
jgi:uncharacterized MAPEG superfamily protein